MLKSGDCRQNQHRDSLHSTSDNINEDVCMNETSILSSDPSVTESSKPSEREIELENMLQNLKDKFSSLPINDHLRLRILTIVSDTWSIKKISGEFQCSWQFAKKSKDLKSTGGVLAETTAKQGRALAEDVVQKVVDFYQENSRIMAGVKDIKSVKTDGGRILMQKRLLLLDLRGLYALYKETW